LFLLRVLGQLLVAAFQLPFLPPMAAWYSGLIPYPVLLPLQIGILLLQVKIGCDVGRKSGLFGTRKDRFGRGVQWFSVLYFTAMLIRYVVTMALHPEQRWFGGTIPIVFHWVLAAYLWVLGHYHTRVASQV
jgi:hypothetical protein